MNRLIAILIFIFPACLHAESNMMLEKANQFYHNKKYNEAIELYTQLLSDGYDHEVLYYNLGNAYYKTNHTGLAVWCYKKALNLNNNAIYRDNLLLAQKRIPNPIPDPKEIFFMQWWHNILSLLSSNGWALLGLLLFLSSIGLLLAKKLGKIASLPSSMVWLGVIGSILSVSFSLLRHFTVAHAIVIAPSVLNAADRSQSGNLSEGTEVSILSKGRTQLLISLPDGRTGSVPIQNVKEL